jgi:hypothetical protein
MEVCENCGKVIGLKETPCLYKTRVVCEPCHTALVVETAGIIVKPKAEIVPPQIVKRVIHDGPKCQLCGSLMTRTKQGSGGIGLFLLGLLVILLIPFLGVLIGGILIVVSIVRACSGRMVLKCQGCGAIVPCA